MAYPHPEEELDSIDLQDDDDDDDLFEEQFTSRSVLEQRLHQRGRFAPQHRHVPVETLKHLDAMFDRLPSATTVEDALCVLRTSFANGG